MPLLGFGSHLMAKDEAPSQWSQLHSDALETKAVFKRLSGKPKYTANCKPTRQNLIWSTVNIHGHSGDYNRNYVGEEAFCLKN